MTTLTSMNIVKFAKVPNAAIADGRLSLRQFKVLCALFSFSNKDGNCWPSRALICERSGVSIGHISSCTSALCDYGWLKKIGKGGFGKPAQYYLDFLHDPIPCGKSEKLLDPIKKTTLHDLGTNPTQIGSFTRPNLERGKEQTRNLPITDQELTSSNSPETHPKNTPNSKGAVAPLAANEQVNSETELQGACKATWKSYAEAYRDRYGVPPLRNLTVNSQVKSFVKRVGYADAPPIAGWFVDHNSSWYIKQGHTVGSLLKDAEKLRTEWATGRAMTETSARQMDGSQSNFNAAQEAKRMSLNRESRNG